MEKNRALAKKKTMVLLKKTMVLWGKIEVFEQIYSFRWYYGKTNYDTIPNTMEL